MNQNMEIFHKDNIFSAFNIILGITFIIGIFSNTLVLIFLIWFDTTINSKTKNFVVNLAFADLLVILVCIPTSILKSYSPFEWPLGDIGCRLSAYTQGVAVTVSIFTITIISIDRYFIISKPLLIRKFYSICRVWLILLIVWLLSFILNIPLLIVNVNTKYLSNELSFHYSFCSENWTYYEQKLAFEFINIIFLFVIPSIVTSYTCIVMIKSLCSHNKNDIQELCLSKSKARLEQKISNKDKKESLEESKISQLFLKRQERKDSSTKLNFNKQQENCAQYTANNNCDNKLMHKRNRVAVFVLILFLLFIISWLPYHTVYLTSEVLTYNNLRYNLTSPNDTSIIEFLNKNIHPYSTCLAFSNSALNGILFCTFSIQFRKLVKVFCRK